MEAPSRKSRSIIAGLCALLAAGLVAFSQTMTFAADEGFHLLAAQSILRGKRPYLDFVFSQTPLNAYWNAGWMRIFGDTWRTTHVVAALMTSLAVFLIAGYVLRRFPVPDWRFASAVAAVFLAGLNIPVVRFGTNAQAYGLSLFLIVAAFRLTVAAVDRRGILFAAGAGLAACAAANATQLTAPVAPVLLVWMLLSNRAGSRWAKAGGFVAAGAIAFLPLVWLFVEGPRQTIFNVLEYNLRYRQVHWPGAVEHNIEVLTAWIIFAEPLLVAMLASYGLLFVRKSGWQRPERREFYLCGCLALALVLHISIALPTFAWYFLFSAPFLGILACAGLYAAGSRLVAPDHLFRPVLVTIILSCLCLAKAQFDVRNDFTWRNAERIAAKVKQVTPPNAVLLSDEPTYFLTRHEPPSGMELSDSHKLDFPPSLAAKLHVVPQAELDRRIKAGVFDVIETDEDEDKIQQLGLRKLYSHSEKINDDAEVFWGKVKRP
jgi:hypothetical protein